ncbi:MAG: histidine phosphatase family protein [Candidatus Nanopelagicales bacterium]|jgi:probable phosphoglycerate mutase|nr:histidine phosphatase family protein [Candidatus Nanopelagicales bacterium]MCU0295925.1 histidine phosphatase family protein [Candidatus Nanopelagicales bacterium]MCU0299561.1 histidine phosphatase family protein [Candidatus Nanopelagicales bacterium]
MLEKRRRLVIWRHGRTAWNLEHRFQGQTDVQLDAVGVKQAEAAAGLLVALRPQVIVSSDLSRAFDTASALAVRCGLTVGTDVRLRETNGGAWEGLRREDLMRDHAELYQQWLAGRQIRPGGDGEDRREVGARVAAAIDDVLESTGPGRTAVVVTHGGAARAVLAPLLNRPFDQISFFGVMRNAAWSVLLENEGGNDPWQLLEYNARSLPEPAEADD